MLYRSGEDGVRSLGQTYAQAAAAAADSEPGEKQPGQSCTHLRFYANGVELPGSYTIFQAVNESHRLKTGQAAVDMEAPNAPNQLRRRRLWDELHTLHYCRFVSEPVFLQHLLGMVVCPLYRFWKELKLIQVARLLTVSS